MDLSKLKPILDAGFQFDMFKKVVDGGKKRFGHYKRDTKELMNKDEIKKCKDLQRVLIDTIQLKQVNYYDYYEGRPKPISKMQVSLKWHSDAKRGP